jgi:hypothetical protein
MATKKKSRPDRCALYVRLTEKERDYLVTASQSAGFSNVSEWIRVTKLKEEITRANA